MDRTQPREITYDTTPDGSRRAMTRFALSMSMHARHLPTLTHDGVTYVPFTGTVVTPDRVTKHQRSVGYWMEYRALRQAAPSQP